MADKINMEMRSNAVNMNLRIIAYQYRIKIVHKKKDEYIDYYIFILLKCILIKF